MKLHTAARIAIALCSVSLATAAHAGIYKFGINGKPLFCLYSKNIPDFAPPNPSLTLKPKSWPTDLVILHYDAAEVRKEIPAFHVNADYRLDDPPNVLSADISLVSQKYTQTNLGDAAGPDAVDIWKRSAHCKTPTVIKVPGTAYFLTKCDTTNFWHIMFDNAPNGGASAEEIYEHVLAECTHTSIGFGPHKGQELENCKRRIYIENLRADYDFQIENAKIIPQMDNFLRTQERSWKKNCSAEK